MKTKNFEIEATKTSIAFWQNAEQKRFETAQEMRSWEAELNSINFELEMVKMTNNHQRFADLYKEKRHIERSLYRSKRSAKTIQTLCDTIVQSPIILN